MNALSSTGYIFITNDHFLFETEWDYLSLSMIACILQADV